VHGASTAVLQAKPPFIILMTAIEHVGAPFVRQACQPIECPSNIRRSAQSAHELAPMNGTLSEAPKSRASSSLYEVTQPHCELVELHEHV
jgi:hypothetical protein